MKTELSHERLVELLHYNALTGNFRWRVSRRGKYGRRGALAGCVKPDGYLYVCVDAYAFLAHRLAWFYVHGEWPPRGFDIDHFDRDKTNNRISNLRLATRKQNNGNRLARGAKRHGGRWVARVRDGGPGIHLGSFATEGEARAAYQRAHAEVHGPFSPYWREAVDG